jgi:omega-amidase
VIVAGVQHDIVWEDPDSNFGPLASRVAGAAARGAELVLLTEMFATGFSMHTDRVAQDTNGSIASFLTSQAATHGVWVGGSFAALPSASTTASPSEDLRPTNCFLLVAPDGTRHRYDKIHPFSYGREDHHYAPGRGSITVDVNGVRVTPFVCYDLRFADVFWAKAAATDLYAVVANWPAARQDHWDTLLRARAIENQAYVLGVNRVGSGGGLDYAGGSLLVDPFGEVVATGGATEGMITGQVDLGRLAEIRATYPFLADRT